MTSFMTDTLILRAKAEGDRREERVEFFMPPLLNVLHTLDSSI